MGRAQPEEDRREWRGKHSLRENVCEEQSDRTSLSEIGVFGLCQQVGLPLRSFGRLRRASYRVPLQ